MTTIRSASSTSASAAPYTDLALAPTTMEEMCAVTQLENQAETQRAAREAQRASQQVQRDATSARVASLHQQADMTLVSGLATAGAEMGSAACSAAGGDWETVGKLTAAGGKGIAAYFSASGQHHGADAAAHEALAARAGDSARESGEAAAAAERVADRVLERLGQVLEAKRRAEEAAARA
jgi:hypothetical protein